jgi:hypothetical protein
LAKILRRNEQKLDLVLAPGQAFLAIGDARSFRKNFFYSISFYVFGMFFAAALNLFLWS